MAIDKSEVGHRIRRLRRERKLSQTRLAGVADLSTYTIKCAEDASRVTWRTAKRLGDLFGVDPRELVTRE